MIDSGASKSILDIDLVPVQFRKKLDIPTFAFQMDGSETAYTEVLTDSQISFTYLDTEMETEKYPLPQTWIKPIKHKFKFIIGLNFMLSHRGGFTITQNGIVISKKSSHVPTLTPEQAYQTQPRYKISELTPKKRGGPNNQIQNYIEKPPAVNIYRLGSYLECPIEDFEDWLDQELGRTSNIIIDQEITYKDFVDLLDLEYTCSNYKGNKELIQKKN